MKERSLQDEEMDIWKGKNRARDMSESRRVDGKKESRPFLFNTRIKHALEVENVKKGNENCCDMVMLVGVMIAFCSARP